MNKRASKWWEVSPQKNQLTARKEEFAEILDQHRWERKNYGRAYSWDTGQDIQDFWEKYQAIKEDKHA